MSVISVASTASVWRGYEYFEAGAVKQLEKADDGLLIGKVSGSGKNIYDVTVDLAHPKRSSCTCPMLPADGSYASIWWLPILQLFHWRQSSILPRSGKLRTNRKNTKNR